MTQITAHASNNTPTTGFNASATDPTNAYSSNDQYATFVADANPRNDEYAHCWHGFSSTFASIPDGSTINSVNLHIEFKLSANWSQGFIYTSVWENSTSGAALTLGVTGAIGPDNQYSVSTSTGYLSDTDWNIPLTGTLPTLAQLKTSTFGVRVQHYQGNNGTAGLTTSIDDIYIVVDYTAGATTQNGNFTAAATVKKTQTGSFAAAAVIKKTITGTPFALDAAISINVPGDFPADATVLATMPGSTQADATVFATMAGSTTADAVVLAPSGTKGFAVDALLALIKTGSFSADATILRTQTGSFPADATFLDTITPTGFGVDAWVSGTIEDSFLVDARIGVPATAPVWTTPADTVSISASPTLAFNTPDLGGDLHFHMELDKVATFDGVDYRSYKSNFDQTGWEYWDGGGWQAVPASGMPAAYAGNEARYTISDPLASGTWYRRVRAGT